MYPSHTCTLFTLERIEILQGAITRGERAPALKIKKDPSNDRSLIFWGGRTRTSEMAVPKTAALPLGDTPISGTSLLYTIKFYCQ